MHSTPPQLEELTHTIITCLSLSQLLLTSSQAQRHPQLYVRAVGVATPDYNKRWLSSACSTIIAIVTTAFVQKLMSERKIYKSIVTHDLLLQVTHHE